MKLKVGMCRGVVEAAEGLFLGGVKRHVSSAFGEQTIPPFDSGVLAVRWAVVVAQTNKDCGRKVGTVRVEKWDGKAWVEAAE